MTRLPTAAIIGAGSSGIAAAKALLERGIPFDCFEKSDRVGGNWVFGNINGMSSAYRSLHINTSRQRMEFSDFPMPSEYPDFPHHTQIAAYFDAYVDRSGLRERIAFRTGVEHVAPRAAGGYELTLDSGETRAYDCVLVANGHHWDPRWPEPAFPGSFDGTQMHAHDYVDHDILRGRRVLVVGIGNSAMDIAVESSYVAVRTFLSSRRGAYVLPKYALGRPIDQIGTTALVTRLPYRVRQLVMSALFRIAVGNVERFGLPKPDHRIGEAHPTVSSDLLGRMAHGEVSWKPNIAELAGDRVRFADGTVEQVDVIVYCTGYKVTFPFFDPNFVCAPENDLPLFRRVFHPAHPDLFFVALLQPIGATMPLAEAQGKWIAAYLRGEYHLPAAAALRGDIERERAAMFKRYVASERHTMQVDFDGYLHELGRELKAGGQRARRAGFALPVPPRGAAPDRVAS